VKDDLLLIFQISSHGTISLMRNVAVVLGLALSSLALHAQYKILSTTKIGGEGGYDYLYADSVDRRLYVARSGPVGVLHVYDLDSLAEIGKIEGVSAHGATVDVKLQHGFATSKPVTMFDARTLKVIKTIDTGGNPDGYLTDQEAGRTYILSHSQPNITVLDDRDGSILGTIDAGGAVEQAVLDGIGHLYVDLEDKDAIAVIDIHSMKMIGKYDISSKGGGCAGLAIDAKNGILFASCRDKNNMLIVHAADGNILTSLPIGVGSDGATFDPGTMEAFSSQGDGTLTVIRENSPTDFAVEQTVKTPARARTLTLDTKRHHILTQTAAYGPIPAAISGQRTNRPPMIPDSFEIIVIGK
jgi:DNA-binding beta-propeller fold protein YncE